MSRFQCCSFHFRSCAASWNMHFFPKCTVRTLCMWHKFIVMNILWTWLAFQFLFRLLLLLPLLRVLLLHFDVAWRATAGSCKSSTNRFLSRSAVPSIETCLCCNQTLCSAENTSTDSICPLRNTNQKNERKCVYERDGEREQGRRHTMKRRDEQTNNWIDKYYILRAFNNELNMNSKSILFDDLSVLTARTVSSPSSSRSKKTIAKSIEGERGREFNKTTNLMEHRRDTSSDAATTTITKHTVSTAVYRKQTSCSKQIVMNSPKKEITF